MQPISQELQDLIDRQTVVASRHFDFNSEDKSEEVLDFGAITRQADAITSGNIALTLVNSNGQWNILLENKNNWLLKEGVIKLDFLVGDPPLEESLTFFKGKLEDVRFAGDTVSFSLRDKMAYLMERMVGSTEQPVDYYSGIYASGINPADLFWDIVTNYGGLDGTLSSANTDIDYDVWVKWKERMTSLNLKVQAEFTGKTIREILELLAELSNSTIYAEGDSRLVCRHWLEGLDLAGAQDYDENKIFSAPEVRFGTGDVLNKIIVYYGYQPATDTWSGSVMKEDATSEGLYGVREKNYEDTSLWVYDSVSADSFADKRLQWCKEPKEIISFRTGLMGFPQQIGDGVRVEYPLLNIHFSADKAYMIQKLDFDPSSGIVDIEAREVALKKWFKLDDVDSPGHEGRGYLDKDYNPLF